MSYGAEKIILGADVLERQIMVSGWREGSSIQLDEFLEKYLALGIQYVLCTDIKRDGMLTGPPLDLYQSILEKFSGIKLIASGGVAGMDDLDALKKLDVYGVVVGKKINLSDLKKF